MVTVVCAAATEDEDAGIIVELDDIILPLWVVEELLEKNVNVVTPDDVSITVPLCVNGIGLFVQPASAPIPSTDRSKREERESCIARYGNLSLHTCTRGHPKKTLLIF